jgi:hypothetical protein
LIDSVEALEQFDDGLGWMSLLSVVWDVQTKLSVDHFHCSRYVHFAGLTKVLEMQRHLYMQNDPSTTEEVPEVIGTDRSGDV